MFKNRFKVTKQMRKELRTAARQEKELTPAKSDKLLRGYEKTMAILSRGCSVTAA